MIPRRRGGPMVYRLRPGTVLDSYDDPVESWDVPVRTPLPGAWLQEQDSVETAGDGRTRIVARAVLYVPGAVDLTAADRVEHDGEVFLVDGRPVPHRNPARIVYTSAALKRSTG